VTLFFGCYWEVTERAQRNNFIPAAQITLKMVTCLNLTPWRKAVLSFIGRGLQAWLLWEASRSFPYIWQSPCQLAARWTCRCPRPSPSLMVVASVITYSGRGGRRGEQPSTWQPEERSQNGREKQGQCRRGGGGAPGTRAQVPLKLME